MPRVKVYLNSYTIYAMLDRESATDLVYPDITCASSLTVSTILHPLVGVQEAYSFYAR